MRLLPNQGKRNEWHREVVWQWKFESPGPLFLDGEIMGKFVKLCKFCFSTYNMRVVEIFALQNVEDYIG